MRFNWKLVFIGGLVYYAAQWVVGAVTGPLLHQGILVEVYQAHASFWRPELNQVPPDMAALLPRWIASGLIASFLAAAVYGWVRPALCGAGWKRGLQFGVIMIMLTVGFMLGWSGIFNLPDSLWRWWLLEAIAYYVVGGIALGWVAEKLDPVKA